MMNFHSQLRDISKYSKVCLMFQQIFISSETKSYVVSNFQVERVRV